MFWFSLFLTVLKVASLARWICFLKNLTELLSQLVSMAAVICKPLHPKAKEIDQKKVSLSVKINTY